MLAIQRTAARRGRRGESAMKVKSKLKAGLLGLDGTHN
jgi:hypothetical protein